MIFLVPSLGWCCELTLIDVEFDVCWKCTPHDVFELVKTCTEVQTKKSAWPSSTTKSLQEEGDGVIISWWVVLIVLSLMMRVETWEWWSESSEGFCFKELPQLKIITLDPPSKEKGEKESVQQQQPRSSNSVVVTTATSIMDKMNYQTYHGGTEGSWTPTIIVAIILIIRYLLRNSITLQRFIGRQKIYWRKRLGYRDESKYQMGVGDGANMKLKRQG